MRLEITEDCCATARRLIADGLDPSEMLEFCRGDMVSLRGRADAFAKLRVLENASRGPEFIRWTPRPAFWKAIGGTPARLPMR